MAAIDRSSHYERALRKQQYDQRLEQEERRQLWTFVWILFGFKIASIGLLVFWIEWHEFKYLIGLTTWPWFVIPAVALTPPLLNRLRLRRMRRRREQLRRAEFDVEPTPSSANAVTMTVLDAKGRPIDRRDGTETT